MKNMFPLLPKNDTRKILTNKDGIETIACEGGSHKASGSIYSKKYVPVTLFYKNKIYDEKGMFHTCIDCRNYGANKRKSKKKVIFDKKLQIDQNNIQTSIEKNFQIEQNNIQTLTAINIENIEILDVDVDLHLHLQITKICEGSVHGVCGSPHDKKCVPIHLFYKNEINEIDGLNNNCLDCRNCINKSAREHNRKIRDACKELSQKLIDKGENFRVCENAAHGNLYKSEFDKYKVPIYMFMKDTNDIRVGLFSNCSDCRKNGDKYKYNQKKKQSALELGIDLCSLCLKELTSTNICCNKDGKQSKYCVSCKNKGNLTVKTIRKRFNELRKKCVVKHQTSCMSCNNIFVKNPDNPPFDKLSIIIKDDIKYINYNNELTSVESFLNIYPDLLELRIIEFDHLPKDEFNKLYPDKKFIPKTREVSNVYSEIKMELEAKKCHHLCLECHIKETIRRAEESIITSPNKNKFVDEKIKIANQHKEERGCSLCGYNSLLKFLEFDHLEPASKIGGISEMVHRYDYSPEDVKKEMLKCRVLCKYCHVFHTQTQISDGVI